MIIGLRSCPFCGAEAELIERDNVNPQGGKQYSIRCTNPFCIYKPAAWRVHKADVLSLWNRRATECIVNNGTLTIDMSKEVEQTDCPYREYPCDVCDEQTDCPWK